MWGIWRPSVDVRKTLVTKLDNCAMPGRRETSSSGWICVIGMVASNWGPREV